MLYVYLPYILIIYVEFVLLFSSQVVAIILFTGSENTPFE